MTNKEIAVKLYCAKLQTFAAHMHQERQRQDKWASIMPSTQEMISEIKQLRDELDVAFPE